jgi:hypothetical protein
VVYYFCLTRVREEHRWASDRGPRPPCWPNGRDGLPFNQVNQVNGLVHIGSGQGVVNGLCNQRLALVPPTPTPFVIQGNDKQVGCVEPLQHRLPIVLPGAHITQWTAQAVEDRRLKQELLHLCRLLAEDLFHLGITSAAGSVQFCRKQPGVGARPASLRQAASSSSSSRTQRATWSKSAGWVDDAGRKRYRPRAMILAAANNQEVSGV